MNGGSADGPRLLVYSQDGLGLGHLRRTSLLVLEFLAAHPGGSALTISDSPLGQFFRSGPGHDYLKLPSIYKSAPGRWGPVSLSLPFSDVLALRREIIRSTALSYRPDVVLVDHLPHGAMGELVPALEALATLPVRMVLGLRDILDAPATIRRHWHLEGAFEAVEEHYDDVLVYGSREVFDIAQEYSWPEAASERLRYCGYVASTTPPRASGALRTRYVRRRPGTELVVAMAGGGADGYRLFDALLDAVPEVLEERPCSFVVVTGPLLPRAERLELLRRARGLPVHVITSVSDSRSYMRAADLVVAMAGYNTSVELLSVPTPAVLVPRPGPSAEQTMRARLFAERGWVDWLSPAEFSPAALRDAMVNALATPVRVPPVLPDLSGRTEAASHLVVAADAVSSAARPVLQPAPVLVEEREATAT